jgi:hypothetical protein
LELTKKLGGIVIAVVINGKAGLTVEFIKTNLEVALSVDGLKFQLKNFWEKIFLWTL